MPLKKQEFQSLSFRQALFLSQIFKFKVMKQIFLITSLLVILLARCSPSVYEQIQNIDYSAIEEQCQNLEGKSVEAVYRLWGSPNSESYSGGYRVLKYVDQMGYKGHLIILKHDIFVKRGRIEICDFKYSVMK